MDFYSTQISNLVEQLSHLPWNRCKISTASGISYPEYAAGSGGRLVQCDA